MVENAGGERRLTVLDGESAMRIVRKVLAADLACEERCFDEEYISTCWEPVFSSDPALVQQ